MSYQVVPRRPINPSRIVNPNPNPARIPQQTEQGLMVLIWVRNSGVNVSSFMHNLNSSEIFPLGDPWMHELRKNISQQPLGLHESDQTWNVHVHFFAGFYNYRLPFQIPRVYHEWLQMQPKTYLYVIMFMFISFQCYINLSFCPFRVSRLWSPHIQQLQLEA